MRLAGAACDGGQRGRYGADLVLIVPPVAPGLAAGLRVVAGPRLGRWAQEEQADAGGEEDHHENDLQGTIERFIPLYGAAAGPTASTASGRKPARVDSRGRRCQFAGLFAIAAPARLA